MDLSKIALPAPRSRVLRGVSLFALLLSLSACSLFEDEEKGASLTFRNRSRSNLTYDIVLDGAVVGSVPVDRQQRIQTSPGRHSFQFLFSNTGQAACSRAFVRLGDGDAQVVTCTN